MEVRPGVTHCAEATHSHADYTVDRQSGFHTSLLWSGEPSQGHEDDLSFKPRLRRDALEGKEPSSNMARSSSPEQPHWFLIALASGKGRLSQCGPGRDLQGPPVGIP